MNNTLNKASIFAFGLLIGGASSWYLLRTKYEKLVNDEIESVKESFNKNFKTISVNVVDQTTSNKNDQRFDKIVSQEYMDVINANKYTTRSEDCLEKKKGEATVNDENIFIIAPDEFGETDNETVSLIYYADGILTDDNNEPIDNIEEIIGNDALNHFGEYETDSVFVRNNDLKADYEILLDIREFSSVANE